LGLAIVYGIIKQHNGYINVYSELANDTTFKIYLSLIIAEAEMKTSTLPENVKGGLETILLAEDDNSLRDMISTVLKEFGYRVIEAKDGQEAVSKFQENQDAIHLVVLDIVMPKMSGKEAGDAIMKMRPHAMILFQSGYPADSMQHEGLPDGAINFLNKPVSLQEFLQKVRDILDK